MISISELYLLKTILQKGLVTSSELKSLMMRASTLNLSPMALLEREKAITQSEKDACLEDARQHPQWPFHSTNRQRENQDFYNLLVQRELLPEGQIIPDSPISCLYREVLGKHPGSQDALMDSLGVEKPGMVECPHCRYQIEVNEYRPWRRYPCLFCSNLLKKASSPHPSWEGFSFSDQSSERINQNPGDFQREKKFSALLLLGVLLIFFLLLTASLVLLKKNQTAIQRKRYIERIGNILHNTKKIPGDSEKGEPLLKEVEKSIKTYLMGKEKLLEVLKKLNLAIDQSSQEGDLYYWRGVVYKELGRKKEAARDFQKYLKLRPQSPQKKDLENFIEKHL